MIKYSKTNKKPCSRSVWWQNKANKKKREVKSSLFYLSLKVSKMKYIENATAMIKPIAATVGFSLPKNTQHRIAIIIGMQDKSAFNSFIVYLIISQIENKVIRLAF